eukprot:CAMPEP_0176144078 /NCGR_PEP_ID=MMETSP0120_2-20121206/73342_1 /TAXON_ID=160619 /ORGANISM="Kryptoperidinium foliaceum, Strain CCMP 1326" /LENGTH=76 /DNA_ID=CAMNT_0017480417 /DNA_START=63 /DNA_END=290 /DNA_ORIENTATION=-
MSRGARLNQLCSLNGLRASGCVADFAKMPAHGAVCGEEAPPPLEQRPVCEAGLSEQVEDEAKLAMNDVERGIERAG